MKLFAVSFNEIHLKNVASKFHCIMLGMPKQGGESIYLSLTFNQL